MKIEEIEKICEDFASENLIGINPHRVILFASIQRITPQLLKIAKLAKERAKYDKDTYTALDKAIEELENGEE